jgi:hypothetical protein
MQMRFRAATGRRAPDSVLASSTMPACSQASALQNTGAPDFTNGHSKGGGGSFAGSAPPPARTLLSPCDFLAPATVARTCRPGALTWRRNTCVLPAGQVRDSVNPSVGTRQLIRTRQCCEARYIYSSKRRNRINGLHRAVGYQ